MKTYSKKTEKTTNIVNFVTKRRNHCEGKAQQFEQHTMEEFARFVKALTATEAADKPGMQARWSMVNPTTLEMFIADSLKRGKNLFKLEQEVIVIDEFLRWIYRQNKSRYPHVCKDALAVMERLNRVETWD